MASCIQSKLIPTRSPSGTIGTTTARGRVGGGSQRRVVIYRRQRQPVRQDGQQPSHDAVGEHRLGRGHGGVRRLLRGGDEQGVQPPRRGAQPAAQIVHELHPISLDTHLSEERPER